MVGMMITYVAPLVLVLTLSLLKEAYDEVGRYLRDRELNLTKFEGINQKAPHDIKQISA